MNKIKTKENRHDIKVLDKVSVVSAHMKKELIHSIDQAENLLDDGQVSPSEYANNKVQYVSADISKEAAYIIAANTKKAAQNDLIAIQRRRAIINNEKNTYQQSKEPYCQQKQHSPAYSHPQMQRPNSERINNQGRELAIKQAKAKAVKQSSHSIKQTAKSTGNISAKHAQRTVKTSDQASKAAIKTAQNTARATQKASVATEKATKLAAQSARYAVKQAVVTARAAAKAISASVKAIIAAAKELIAAIATGGWVAVVVIIVICLIALIAGSCFGIFFSSEDTGSEQTMQQVVQEINLDYQNRLDEIEASVDYDELKMSGSRALWPEVLSIYAVKTTTDPDNPQEVATMTDVKKQLLKDIFWAMNEISYRTETRTEKGVVEKGDGSGSIHDAEEEEANTILYITISHKTSEEMASQYGFNAEQNEQLAELLADKNNSMWLAVLYGSFNPDNQIVMVALSQLGNVGGEPYCSWYGFGSRVEWCACFVSWCADQCGYIETGVIPKYAGCVWGVQWFRERGQWMDNAAVPEPGMIIFFDWDNKGSSGPQDGQSDHTGIVERVEDGVVYTIEGNTGDSCAERHYSIGYYEILGYGLPAY